MVGGVVVSVGEGGGLPSVLFVASWVGLFWAVKMGLSFSFLSSLCGLGGGCTESVGALSVGFVCASIWDSLFVATAVGAIVGGAAGGGLFVMVHFSARRSVFRPSGYLGHGFTGITGGLGGLLGGVPIAILSVNFR